MPQYKSRYCCVRTLRMTSCDLCVTSAFYEHYLSAFNGFDEEKILRRKRICTYGCPSTVRMRVRITISAVHLCVQWVPALSHEVCMSMKAQVATGVFEAKNVAQTGRRRIYEHCWGISTDVHVQWYAMSLNARILLWNILKYVKWTFMWYLAAKWNLFSIRWHFVASA